MLICIGGKQNYILYMKHAIPPVDWLMNENEFSQKKKQKKNLDKTTWSSPLVDLGGIRSDGELLLSSVLQLAQMQAYKLECRVLNETN